MPLLNPGGTSGSVGGAATSKAGITEQLEAMASMLRQLGGNADIVRGSGATTDPLVAPFTLYVNPYIGKDTFATGAFNTFESSGTDEQKIAQKLKRLHNQHLTRGFSPGAPFRTINRAAIEAAIITSRSYYTFSDTRAQVDCVLIRLSAGRHVIYNDPGNSGSAIAVSAWADGFDPTWQHLITFNPNEGGLLLPRGASFNGDDLRKCVFSPNYVPTPADEAADYSNRSTILRVTPLALGGQFTFTDKIGATTSHHLLDCIQYSTQAQLNAFYTKVFTACGTGADLGNALMVARPTEYQIVGPISGLPSATWDTTASASPYMFNLSIRSDFGLCGCFLDGDKVGGLKSLVTAQFTGVSLQKDMNCWQIYSGGSWITPNYAQYIAAPPDNVRMKPERRSRHLTAINDAFVQAVSVFCIGQGFGYFTDEGGEITVTNSNSSFGGCGAVSRGYKRAAFPQDSSWSVARIQAPLTPADKSGNVRTIRIGNISTLSTSPNRLILTAPLDYEGTSATVPTILKNLQYTFKSGTYIWIENPAGEDWRAQLTGAAWSSTNPTFIEISAQPVMASGSPVLAPADAVGKRVYMRRLSDSRTAGERRLSLQLSNTTDARLPERNFVLQTSPTVPGGAISRVLNKTNELLIVSNTGAGSITGGGVTQSAEITVRRGAAVNSYAQNNYYQQGTVVRSGNKHFQAASSNYAPDATPVAPLWIETFVHMESDYNSEDNFKNECPIIIIDTDTDTSGTSTTLGVNWSTAFTDAGAIRDQYRSGTDYLGAHALLMAMGLSDANAHAALVPRARASRLRDPASGTDFPVAPSGGAASGRGNWAIEFRRPSVLRLYGHAWEWAGWLNYSKSLPAAQRQLSVFNKFTYYFTNISGGRVVPQGSNEDGFNISPVGLTDIYTGETRSADSLSAPPIDLPTSFADILITNLTVDGILDLQGVTTILGLPMPSEATTLILGLVRLATLAQAQAGTAGSLAITASVGKAAYMPLNISTLPTLP